jgi:hypothetical protein
LSKSISIETLLFTHGALTGNGNKKARCAVRVSGLGLPISAFLGRHPKCSANTLIAW